MRCGKQWVRVCGCMCACLCTEAARGVPVYVGVHKCLCSTPSTSFLDATIERQKRKKNVTNKTKAHTIARRYRHAETHILTHIKQHAHRNRPRGEASPKKCYGDGAVKYLFTPLSPRAESPASISTLSLSLAASPQPHTTAAVVHHTLPKKEKS